MNGVGITLMNWTASPRWATVDGEHILLPPASEFTVEGARHAYILAVGSKPRQRKAHRKEVSP